MSKKKCPRCGKVFDDKEKLFFHLETIGLVLNIIII